MKSAWTAFERWLNWDVALRLTTSIHFLIDTCAWEKFSAWNDLALYKDPFEMS